MGTGRDLRGFDFLCKGIPRSFLWGGVRVMTASGGLQPEGHRGGLRPPRESEGGIL